MGWSVLGANWKFNDQPPLKQSTPININTVLLYWLWTEKPEPMTREIEYVIANYSVWGNAMSWLFLEHLVIWLLFLASDFLYKGCAIIRERDFTQGTTRETTPERRRPEQRGTALLPETGGSQNFVHLTYLWSILDREMTPHMSGLICSPHMSGLICSSHISGLVCWPHISGLICSPHISGLICSPYKSGLIGDNIRFGLPDFDIGSD